MHQKNRNCMDVLYVDDDHDDREIFAEVLTYIHADVNLTTACDGAEALDLLRHKKIVPNVIFLDVNMPVMGGFDTLLEIRKMTALRNTKIVM